MYEVKPPETELLVAEPSQLEGCSHPAVHKLDYYGIWFCISRSNTKPDSPVVCVHHHDRETAILAHNAAVKVIQERDSHV